MNDPRIDVLTSAFFHDPLLKCFWPNEEARTKQVSALMEFLLAMSPKTWTAKTDDGKCAAVIGAFPPGEYPPGFCHSMLILAKLTKLFFKSLFITPLSVMKRFTRIIRQFDKIHPQKPHWYILVLGVDPLNHGKGIGGDLLKPILRDADKKRLIVYLECSNPKSAAFYAKSGFKIRDEIIPFAPCPPVWTLVRDPISVAGEDH